MDCARDDASDARELFLFLLQDLRPSVILLNGQGRPICAGTVPQTKVDHWTCQFRQFVVRSGRGLGLARSLGEQRKLRWEYFHW